MSHPRDCAVRWRSEPPGPGERPLGYGEPDPYVDAKTTKEAMEAKDAGDKQREVWRTRLSGAMAQKQGAEAAFVQTVAEVDAAFTTRGGGRVDRHSDEDSMFTELEAFSYLDVEVLKEKPAIKRFFTPSPEFKERVVLAFAGIYLNADQRNPFATFYPVDRTDRVYPPLAIIRDIQVMPSLRGHQLEADPTYSPRFGARLVQAILLAACRSHTPMVIAADVHRPFLSAIAGRSYGWRFFLTQTAKPIAETKMKAPFDPNQDIGGPWHHALEPRMRDEAQWPKVKQVDMDRIQYACLHWLPIEVNQPHRWKTLCHMYWLTPVARIELWKRGRGPAQPEVALREIQAWLAGPPPTHPMVKELAGLSLRRFPDRVVVASVSGPYAGGQRLTLVLLLVTMGRLAGFGLELLPQVAAVMRPVLEPAAYHDVVTPTIVRHYFEERPQFDEEDDGSLRWTPTQRSATMGPARDVPGPVLWEPKPEEDRGTAAPPMVEPSPPRPPSPAPPPRLLPAASYRDGVLQLMHTYRAARDQGAPLHVLVGVILSTSDWPAPLPGEAPPQELGADVVSDFAHRIRESVGVPIIITLGAMRALVVVWNKLVHGLAARLAKDIVWLFVLEVRQTALALVTTRAAEISALEWPGARQDLHGVLIDLYYWVADMLRMQHDPHSFFYGLVEILAGTGAEPSPPRDPSQPDEPSDLFPLSPPERPPSPVPPPISPERPRVRPPSPPLYIERPSPWAVVVDDILNGAAGADPLRIVAILREGPRPWPGDRHRLDRIKRIVRYVHGYVPRLDQPDMFPALANYARLIMAFFDRLWPKEAPGGQMRELLRPTAPLLDDPRLSAALDQFNELHPARLRLEVEPVLSNFVFWLWRRDEEHADAWSSLLIRVRGLTDFPPSPQPPRKRPRLQGRPGYCGYCATGMQGRPTIFASHVLAFAVCEPCRDIVRGLLRTRHPW